MKKQPKGKTPLPPPTSVVAAIQDTHNSTNTPLPSPLSLAGVTPVEIATIAAHLSRPKISARDCVIRAYEILEWAIFGQTALQHHPDGDFKTSGMTDWLIAQKDPSAKKESALAWQKLAQNAAEASQEAERFAGKTKKEIKTAEKLQRDEELEDKRCREIVLKYLRCSADGKPLPIALETALPLIIPGKEEAPLGAFQSYLCNLRGVTDDEAKRILKSWSEHGVPWVDFEEALFGYFSFKTGRKRANLRENSLNAVAAKKAKAEIEGRTKGKQGRVKSPKDGRLGARPPTGIL